MKIYCDMDGVLVDLMSGVALALGYEIVDPHQYHPQNAGDTEIPWELIAEYQLFWESLDWMPDGQELWETLIQLNLPISILSARAESDSNCAPGKLRWLSAHLGSELQDVHIVERKDKKKFAKNGIISNILIDDYEKNIIEWEDAGGIGIHHRSTAKTLQSLHGVLQSVAKHLENVVGQD